MVMVGEQEDLLLVILSFIEVPKLVWMKLVSRRWRIYLIDVAIRNKLPPTGRIPFKNGIELDDEVNKYYNDKHRYAERIARTRGWPINMWDVSKVTDFEGLFQFKSGFNDDISKWDVSNAVSMRGMFYSARSFNQNLESWNTSNVRNMEGMFYYASSFDGNISLWDTSNVKKMTCMFYSASSFNGDISSWDTSKVEHMHNMFDGALKLPVGFRPRFEH